MEKTIDDLSKIIMDQQSQLTELSKKLEEVDEKVKSGEHGEITNPPPPHH